jgi:hypothetical protein
MCVGLRLEKMQGAAGTNAVSARRLTWRASDSREARARPMLTMHCRAVTLRARVFTSASSEMYTWWCGMEDKNNKAAVSFEGEKYMAKARKSQGHPEHAQLRLCQGQRDRDLPWGIVCRETLFSQPPAR